MSKIQRTIVELLSARLDPNHPGYRGTLEVRAALYSARVYLDTYVRPLLHALECGEQYRGQYDEIRGDAANRHRRARRGS